MDRIAVIGCGGAGKTTLVHAIAARLGLPAVHIDSYGLRERGEPGQRTLTAEEWERLHRDLAAGERWVIDGMRVWAVAGDYLERAEMVAFLELPTRTCLRGILERRLRFRCDRPELGVYDRINRDFLRFVWTFRRRRRPAVLARLRGVRSPQVVVLRSRHDVRRFVASLPAAAAVAHPLDGQPRWRPPGVTVRLRRPRAVRPRCARVRARAASPAPGTRATRSRRRPRAP
jgi:adenylate kinase family enzyme